MMNMMVRFKALLQGRSGRWAGVRKEFLIANPTCAVCGGKVKLTAHHIVPFHLDKALELDPSNLLPLCESMKNGINCHLAIGHLGSFRSINPNVRADAHIWLHKITTRKEC